MYIYIYVYIYIYIYIYVYYLKYFKPFSLLPSPLIHFYTNRVLKLNLEMIVSFKRLITESIISFSIEGTEFEIY